MNKIILALFLSLCTAVSGCANVLSSIILKAQDAQLILTTIQGFSNAYFFAHPNSSQQTAINADITNAETALDGAIRTVNGISDITQAQADGAFANFEAAYKDLLTLVAAIGVLPDNVQMATRTSTGGLSVPTPLLMLKKAETQAKN